MTLLQMRYFIAVCEYGNVTKAAEKLHISQPSLSYAIKELEDEYQVVLFRRSRKKMILTEKGRFLWEKADEIIEKLNELDAQMESMCKSRLLIGISPIIEEIISSQIFPYFCKENPGIQIRITTMGSSDGREMVRNGELDMALIIADQSEDRELVKYVMGRLEGIALREPVCMNICLIWRRDRCLRQESKRFIGFIKKAAYDAERETNAGKIPT